MIRDPDREIVPGACAHTFKCDVGLEAPSLLQTVKRIVLPAADGQSEVEPSRLELPGEPSHGGRALLAGAASENERTELEEAVRFLRDLFGDGLGHPAAETFKEARSCGSPITSSKRARKRLGVQDREGWFRPGVAGGFQWLPKMTPRTDTSPSLPSSSSLLSMVNEKPKKNTLYDDDFFVLFEHALESSGSKRGRPLEAVEEYGLAANLLSLPGAPCRSPSPAAPRRP